MPRFIPFVALVCLCLFARLSNTSAEEKKDTVRSLGPFKLDLGDPEHEKLFSSSQSFVITSGKEAIKRFGKTLGPALIEGVDFQKEQAVVIAWSTGGPPFGKLMWHAKDENSIEFYVKGPRASARGDALRFGVDRFAVPVGVKVTYDPEER